MKFIKKWWIVFIFMFMFELLIPRGYIKKEIIIKDRKTGRIIYRSVKISLNQQNIFERDTLIKFSPVNRYRDPITGLKVERRNGKKN